MMQGCYEFTCSSNNESIAVCLHTLCFISFSFSMTVIYCIYIVQKCSNLLKQGLVICHKLSCGYMNRNTKSKSSLGHMTLQRMIFFYIFTFFPYIAYPYEEIVVQNTLAVE
jgi:hypothetical protein